MKKLKIEVYKNPRINYETNKVVVIYKLPLMWVLCLWVTLKKKILRSNLKINTFWVDGISPVCREIKINAASWRALDIIYNRKFGEKKEFHERVADFWLMILNAQAARNRLKLVGNILKIEIESRLKSEKEVRLLSIACGAAQGIIEILTEFKGRPLKAFLLDLDLSALEHSKKMAKGAGVEDMVVYINKSAKELSNVMKEVNPQIVEMIGFLEYRTKEQAIDLIKRIFGLLDFGGVMIACNISKNLEMPFFNWVIEWKMIYRSPEELLVVLIGGGFDSKDCAIVTEPMRIYNLSICRKNNR